MVRLADLRLLDSAGAASPSNSILAPPTPTAGPSKHRLADLAIRGGPPLFAEALHVGRPNIGDRARLFERLDAMLDRGMLSNGGPLVVEFEARLSRTLGAPHVIAVANATLGLGLVASALDLRGEVIVPAFTFIALPNVLLAMGIRPVFADVDIESATLDPAHVESLITPDTSAIFGVHLWGRPCSPDRLQALADRHGLKLLFDAAHAFGCSHGGRKVGSFGDAEVFSFHATKYINSFEGGAIATSDGSLAGDLGTRRSFGFVEEDLTAHWGTNAKMSEASAAMGLTSLDAMDRFLAVNHLNLERYREHLRGIRGIRLPAEATEDERNHQHVVIRVDAAEAGITRDRLHDILRAENVVARRYFYPGCHRMEPYASLPGPGVAPLPRTELLSSEVLSLPTGTAITPDMVDAICDLIRFSVGHAPSLVSE